MAKELKIYTKTGDGGTTSLFGGQRVNKNSLRIKAYGEVDELNSRIGMTLAEFGTSDIEHIKKKLIRVQNELFVLGSDLATPLDVKLKIPRVKKSFATRLEKEIDQMTASLPPLRNFILPGGGRVGSGLHLARTVARRAERAIVDLQDSEKINKNSLIYVNRLSDWFFTLARLVNKIEGNRETAWIGRK
ncbi:MAG TPA: cob(I)yrinic acid a,c-diamide adenosyltransferase [Candidatus Saccharimonadales bacterium]|nr:cob(I)yrinic acid a,c-diamide adenosyltransferase [Candidatus Saccharimonadales bacterium]